MSRIVTEITPISNDDFFVVLNHINAIFDFPVHYHPEYELNLVLNSSGKRIIGDSIQDFEDMDLVLIGPNSPHAWTGNKENNDAQVITLQFHEDFLSDKALNRKIRSWDSKVDFSNEIIDLKKIEQKLNNALAIDDLTECYNEDIYPIRIKVISKITVEKNKVIKEKNNLIQSYLVQIVIAIVFFIFGIMVTKLS